VSTGFFGKFYANLTATLDEGMLLKPFWSTWTHYKEAVNLSLVLQYAREVVEKGLGWISHMDIYDHSETCYGEQKCNLDKSISTRTDNVLLISEDLDRYFPKCNYFSLLKSAKYLPIVSQFLNVFNLLNP
jgi:hypothetical protein